MKKIRISQRKSVTTNILIFTVFFLAPLIALAGEANVQRPDIEKPGTFKELLKKKLIIFLKTYSLRLAAEQL